MINSIHPANFVSFDRVEDSSSVDDQYIQEGINTLSQEVLQEMGILAPIVQAAIAQPALIDRIARSMQRRDQAREDEEANKASNAIYRMCKLMQKLSAILTELKIQDHQLYQELREPHSEAYQAQKSAFENKAWFTLAGGVLGGLSSLSAAGLTNDSYKAVAEALGKTFPSVGQVFATFEDGKIQGTNSFTIRDREAQIEEDKKQYQEIDQTASRFWQTLEGIMRDLAQTGEISARG